MRTRFASAASVGLVPKFVVGSPASTAASATAGNSSVTPTTTCTVTVAVAVSPPRSATVAVSWCVPSLRVCVMVPPVPRAPSRSEVQAITAVRSPSSRSLALPVKVIVAEEASVWPLAGAVMETSGAVLPGGGGVTVTLIWLEPVRPWPSVTVAVRVCVPWPSEVVTTAPVPSGPARLEDHTTWVLRSTPALSWALAWRVIASPVK